MASPTVGTPGSVALKGVGGSLREPGGRGQAAKYRLPQLHPLLLEKEVGSDDCMGRTGAPEVGALHLTLEEERGLGPPSAAMSVSRVSSLKKAVDQRDKALTCLNEAMNVSCALLSSREGPRPISCTISTSWSRLQLQDVLTATCLLENSSGFSLDRGWALCIQVRRSSRALDLDSAVSAITYTIPVDQLGPGGQREVTLPLGPGEDGALDLPVTVSCALFYSLREVVGGALALTDPFKDPSSNECTPDVLPEQDGVCLPLSEHTVDMLQGLRFPGLAAPRTQALGPLSPARDPIHTFLETCCGPVSQPAGPASLRAKYLPPSVATVKVSAELLRAALGDDHAGWWHQLASLRPGTLPPSPRI